MNFLADSILAFLFGAGLLLCGAESNPFDWRYNAAGLALMALAAFFIVMAYRRRRP